MEEAGQARGRCVYMLGCCVCIGDNSVCLEQESKRVKGPAPEEEDKDNDASLTPRRRKHKKVENDVLPSWTKNPKAAL